MVNWRKLFGGGEEPMAAPQLLHFKGTQQAFDYACEFMTTEIKEKQALAALVVDGTGVEDSVQALIQNFESKRSENIFDTYRVKVCGDDGGFFAPALCYKRGVNLQPGTLVFWVPMQTDPMLSMLAKDKRSAWIGGIVARLEPSLSTRDGWVVGEQYV